MWQERSWLANLNDSKPRSGGFKAPNADFSLVLVYKAYVPLAPARFQHWDPEGPYSDFVSSRSHLDLSVLTILLPADTVPFLAVA